MRGLLFKIAFVAAVLVPVSSAHGLAISDTDIRDRIHGAWAGGIAGAAWGAPIEFRFNGRVVPAPKVPRFSMRAVNRYTYTDRNGPDETYVEIPFLRAVRASPDAGWPEWGDAFARTAFVLFGADKRARRNLRRGIEPPTSGDPVHNPYAHNIGWQMASDFAGLVSPAQPGTAIDISWRAGHVVVYADGVWGGVMVAAMNAEAFRADTVREIVEAGRRAVPKGTSYRAMIEDVIRWHAAHPLSWKAAWRRLERRWNAHRLAVKRDPRYVHSEFNIDAKLNGGYILLGLLYGGGDYVRSLRISLRAGQDTDCNPKNVGSILGAWLGFSRLPRRFTDGLAYSRAFPGTEYTLSQALDDTYEAARGITAARGGSAGADIWEIPDSPVVSPIAERWPLRADRPPRLAAEATVSGDTVSFSAHAQDRDGIRGYWWSFGDLSGAGGPTPVHAYAAPGTYRAIVWAADGLGRTRARTLTLVVE
jgi:ADP-ribosylglycohydrolase/PKD domain